MVLGVNRIHYLFRNGEIVFALDLILFTRSATPQADRLAGPQES